MATRAAHAPTLLSGMSALEYALSHPGEARLVRRRLMGGVETLGLEEAARLARAGRYHQLFCELADAT